MLQNAFLACALGHTPEPLVGVAVCGWKKKKKKRKTWLGTVGSPDETISFMSCAAG